MKKILITLVGVLAGCATQQRFEELAGRHIGLTETQLVEKLGPPTGRYVTDDAIFLSWERSVLLSPSYHTSIIGGSLITTPIGGGYVGCVITYKLIEREIIDLTNEQEQEARGYISSSYRYEGNACRA
jgi:hypothetical protein